MERLADSVIELAQHAAGRQSISFRREFEPSLPEVECDGEQIKQVLLNLMINAIQASPDGGEIHVAVQLAGESVRVSIRDHGCGMAPAQMERLFDPFFTTKESGTGLGLPVALQIVQQHGGRIWAERNPEGGMTFSFELPIRRREAE